MKKIILIFNILIVFTIKAQIPNNSFEFWTNAGSYNSPNGWANLNATTKSYSVFTCGKLSPGNLSSSCLSLVSLSVTGKGVVPGRVVSGRMDSLTFKPISGFPFTSRPANLSYAMQYMVSAPWDTAFVSVVLTKWNTSLLKRDTVAKGISNYNGMGHSWFTSSVYLNYQSGDLPDSACIVISSSGNAPLNNSFMYIDNLQFIGNVIGIEEQNETENGIYLFPNPTSKYVALNMSNSTTQPIKINIYNAAMQLVLIKTISESTSIIDISQLEKGIYYFEINQNKKSLKKVILN